MPKSDDGSSVANYRSTSLLSILSKLLEIPTHWVTVSHLEVYYKTWAMAVDKGKEVCAIFFDLKKAIKVSLINWFKSDWVCPKMDCVLSAICISNRSQYCVNCKNKVTLFWVTRVFSTYVQNKHLGPLHLSMPWHIGKKPKLMLLEMLGMFQQNLLLEDWFQC